MPIRAEIHTAEGVVQGEVFRPHEIKTGVAYLQYQLEGVTGENTPFFMEAPLSRHAIHTIKDVTINALDL